MHQTTVNSTPKAIKWRCTISASFRSFRTTRRAWIQSHDLDAGDSLHLSFPEIGALGRGLITSISDCPALQVGLGSCVTGRFKTREVVQIIHVDFADGERLSGTPNHRIWSSTAHDWQRLDALNVGDEIQGESGVYRIQSLTTVNDPQPVYNLEVDGEHVYQVTKNRLLVHNSNELCDELQRLLHKKGLNEATDVDLKRIKFLRETLGAKGKLEGLTDVQVFHPSTGNIITDIDEVVGGILWERKSAIFAGDGSPAAINKWIDKHISGKFNKFLEARKHLDGFTDAPIGFKFENPVGDSNFRKAILERIEELRQKFPDIDIPVDGI